MKNYYHPAILIQNQASRYGKKTALKYYDKVDKKWKNYSWKYFADKVNKVAWSLAELGLKEGDKVGIYSQNMPEYFFADFGAYANRLTTVPIYATSSQGQVDYIVNDSQLEYLFVGEQYQYNNAFKSQQENKTIKRIIVFDNSVKFNSDDTTSMYFDYFTTIGENSTAEVLVNVRIKSRKESDIACIIYTSGTTGEPKGVILPHSNFIEAFKLHDEVLDEILTKKQLSVCFLPLAHIFEKAWSYFCFHRGITIAVNQDAKQIQKTVKQIKPTLLCSVPRFWEKVYLGIESKVSESKGVMKWLFEDALKTGKKYNLEYKNQGIKPPLGTLLKFKFYQNTIYKLIKSVIGIQNGILFPTAGAPISDNIVEFMYSLDIPIDVGYGLTETTATVSCYPLKKFRIGSVGKVLNQLEVKIGEKDEILVKGKTVMSGYYKKPKETEEAFTEDGFFKTGDAGYLDDDTLFLTERIKDLFKTSNGKYIAPQLIETKIIEDLYVDMIAVIGDEKKFVSALIIPNYEALEKYANENNISYASIKDLTENPEIIRMIDGRIELKQLNLASYEKIKKYKLLPEPFSMESGELTNTLKVKRKFVSEKYKDLIDEIYKE